MIVPGSDNLRGMLDEDLQVQPAGVDLTVQDIERFAGPGVIDFDNSSRKIARGEELTDEKLEGGSSYRVTYNETIRVPEDAIGVILPRSSLMRNGGHLVSAVWDPGYEGRGQGLLQVLNPHGLIVKKDARIGQIVFIALEEEASSTYEGRFQGENI
ncbi:deoxyuridine 5'-triphosphate nucleotidohydrolase [Candidatus Bipolaricaulota bacterium]|nr:deoxyuridine 5'-triphosphate nucleotidohydrolase [Candidatus Bipolaricaulota bacterium]